MAEYRKIEKIPPTVWDLEGLKKLSSIMRENLNIKHKSDDFSVSCGEVSYSAEALEEIFEKQSIESIDAVTFKAIGWNDRNEIDKSITLSFRPTWSDYQIHSTDETWFKGKSVQLNEFFSSKKIWYSQLRNYLPLIFGLLYVIFSLAAIIFFKLNYFFLVFFLCGNVGDIKFNFFCIFKR